MQKFLIVRVRPHCISIFLEEYFSWNISRLRCLFTLIIAERWKYRVRINLKIIDIYFRKFAAVDNTKNEINAEMSKTCLTLLAKIMH